MKLNPLMKRAYWWLKAALLVTAISTITYGIGTFMPNPLAVKKATEEVRIEHAIWAETLGLNEPSFEYTNSKEFILELNKCVDYINYQTPPDKRVPIEMVTAQAALESAWGKSRFAVKANNLFGIRTFSSEVPHLLPEGVKKWPGWGVRKFKSKCASVQEYIRLLNEHPAYKDFRAMREKTQDPIKLIKTLDAFSTTADYDQRVIRIIKKIRKLEDTYASDKTIK